VCPSFVTRERIDGAFCYWSCKNTTPEHNKITPSFVDFFHNNKNKKRERRFYHQQQHFIMLLLVLFHRIVERRNMSESCVVIDETKLELLVSKHANVEY
jgi:hypothetical protein